MVSSLYPLSTLPILRSKQRFKITMILLYDTTNYPSHRYVINKPYLSSALSENLPDDQIYAIDTVIETVTPDSDKKTPTLKTELHGYD